MTESHLINSFSEVSETAIPIAGGDGDDQGSENQIETSITIVDEEKKIKKRSGSFSLLKAALSIVRPPRKADDVKKRSYTKSLDFDQQVCCTVNWTKLVGSMRPLHLQENLQSPTPSIHASSSTESLEDYLPRASSSSSSSPSSISGAGIMSQYASAINLQDLDNYNDDRSETEGDPDEVFDALTGDEMIDSKAEQFIAQFYMKMKLQNVDSIFDR